MASLATQVEEYLQPLVGLRLSLARRAASMRVLHFGRVSEVEGGTVGEYALHLRCPWRIEGPGGILTGSGDLGQPGLGIDTQDAAFSWLEWDYEQGNLQDERLEDLLGGYDPSTGSAENRGDRLQVVSVASDPAGGIRLWLQDAWLLSAFPDGSVGEQWRLLRPGSEAPHVALIGGQLDLS